jgi:hypothetical protein
MCGPVEPSESCCNQVTRRGPNVIIGQQATIACTRSSLKMSVEKSDGRCIGAGRDLNPRRRYRVVLQHNGGVRVVPFHDAVERRSQHVRVEALRTVGATDEAI